MQTDSNWNWYLCSSPAWRKKHDRRSNHWKSRNCLVEFLSAVVRRCKRDYRSDNSAHVLVLPYSTAEFRNNEDSFWEYYDEIEICETAAVGHFKNAHQARNREMVDRSHLVVFCVQRESGGAWQTMKYAWRQGVPLVNIQKWQQDWLADSLHRIEQQIGKCCICNP